MSFRLQFGVTDGEPRSWDGSLALEKGELLNLRNWHPRPGDKIAGKESWSLSTRKGPNFQRRPWEDELTVAPEPYLLIPGIIVDVRATPETKVVFKTKNGEFPVSPSELRPGQPVRFLSGSVICDRVPAAQLLSTREYEADFVAILRSHTGEVWTAWVGYRNHGNEVFARSFDGKSWSRIAQGNR